MELTLDQALQKGIEAHKAGKVLEADYYYTAILKANPKHPDANHNMGVLVVGTGKAEAALSFFKMALEADSSKDQYWLSYIYALIKLNKMADAKSVFDQAKLKGMKGNGFDQIEERISSVTAKNTNHQEPTQQELNSLMTLYNQKRFLQVFNEAETLTKRFAESLVLWNLMGVSSAQIGKLDEASHAFQKVISIKPVYTEAYNNLGTTLQEQGNLAEAIDAYNQAISIRPDYAEAYYNLGVALHKLDKLEEAIVAYDKALLIKPDYVDAFYNIGFTFQEQGKAEQAIEAYIKVLSIMPDYADAYLNLGVVFNDITFKKPNKDLQNIITQMLEKRSYVRPKDIAKAAISFLKLDTNLQKNLQAADVDRVNQNPLDIISDLNELPLLLKLMAVSPIPDLELEKLFKYLRKNILSRDTSFNEISHELLRFQSALALQCFTNEYIYTETKSEEQVLELLEKKVEALLRRNKQPSPHLILALASYKALKHYEWFSSLFLTDEIRDVYTRQVEEPIYEETLKLKLPIFGQISNKVSSKVREQYEANPYPRWVDLGLRSEPVPVSKVISEIRLKIQYKKIIEVKNPKILIAGCGTGQHSISTAARFASSKVTAIDLSLSSLAYAKRKSEEFAIYNIEYLQGDILDITQLNEQFDIIESAGVLHHMGSPMAGWKALTDCLKPAGLMKIGLYSELARQHIVKIRQEINQLGLSSSLDEMKSFRDMIIKSNKDHHNLIVNFNDFYSLSELKDLLFHVEEHRFTIPIIKQHLNTLRLKFCGFESNKIVSQFKATNTKPDDPYDLDKWQEYEEANPRAFAGMYQFWCQKVDSA